MKTLQYKVLSQRIFNDPVKMLKILNRRRAYEEGMMELENPTSEKLNEIAITAEK